MSLVLGYANKDSAIIMSDGRAGGTVCPSEEYDKTRKINNNIILGFAGYKETCEHFLRGANAWFGEKITECYIDEFLEFVEFMMNLKKTREGLKSTFMIIGKTKQGDIVTVISGESSNYKIVKRIASDPRILLIGGVIDGKIMEKIYVDNLRNINIPIIDCMKKTIQEISMLDKSINQNIFLQTI